MSSIGILPSFLMRTMVPMWSPDLKKIKQVRKYVAFHCGSQSRNTTYQLIQWNVTLLKNNKYTIQNRDFANFACCEIRAKNEDSVNGRERSQQWNVKEMNEEQYTWACDIIITYLCD